MAAFREYAFYLTLHGRSPIDCQVYKTVDTQLQGVIGSETFGPFDDLWDALRWVYRLILLDMDPGKR